MSKIKILAGDFGECEATIDSTHIHFCTAPFKRESKPLNRIAEADIASEESVKKLGGTLGWGITGAALLGPVGMLAGLLVGGRKSMVTFVARFDNGQKILGQTDSKTYSKIMAKTFGR